MLIRLLNAKSGLTKHIQTNAKKKRVFRNLE